MNARTGWTAAILTALMAIVAPPEVQGQEEWSREEKEVVLGIILSPAGRKALTERYDSSEALRQGTNQAVLEELTRRKFEKHATCVLEMKEAVCEMKRARLLTGKTGVPTTVPIADEFRYLLERAADAGIPLEDTMAGIAGGMAGGPAGIPIGVAISEAIQKLADHDPSVASSLTYLLFHSDRPTETGLSHPFVSHTKAASMSFTTAADPAGGEPRALPASREMLLAMRIARSEEEGRLTPREVMRMALEVCEGDFPSATLTAHNLMKEITYGGHSRTPQPDACVATVNAPADGTEAQRLWERYQRAFESTGGGFRMTRPEASGEMQVHLDPDAILSKLADLRPDPSAVPLSEAEDRVFQRLYRPTKVEDKGGPWYHAFGVMFVSSTAKGGRYTGWAMAKGEGLLRRMPFFSSAPDPFKEMISELAADEAGRIVDCLQDVGKFERPDPNAPKGGQASATGETLGRYCTNAPRNTQDMPIPETASRGRDLPEPSPEDVAKVEEELLQRIKESGVDPTLLKGFAMALERYSPNKKVAKAFWMRLLATGDAWRIRDGLIERGEALHEQSLHEAIRKLKREMPDESLPPPRRAAPPK